MALIYIRGRKDPIIVSNERARQVKQYKFGSADKTIAPQPPSALIDLGDEWSGELGKISSIELERHESRIQANFSEDEIRKVEAGLKKFKVREAHVGGRKIYPEVLYMAELGLIRIDESGDYSIRNPGGYKHTQEIIYLVKDRQQKKNFAQEKAAEAAMA